MKINLRYRENFSITKSEFIYLSFIIGVVLSMIDFEFFNFHTKLFLLTLLNYLLVSIDPVSGITVAFFIELFNITYIRSYTSVLMLIPLIFSIKGVNKYHWIKPAIYIGLNVAFMHYARSDAYISEAIVITIIIMLIPRIFFDISNQ